MTRWTLREQACSAGATCRADLNSLEGWLPTLFWRVVRMEYAMFHVKHERRGGMDTRADDQLVGASGDERTVGAGLMIAVYSGKLQAVARRRRGSGGEARECLQCPAVA